jgi:hypothetical protein
MEQGSGGSSNSKQASSAVGVSYYTSFSLFFLSLLYFFALCNSSQGYIKGGDGIMLVRTASLRHLLRKKDMSSSEDLLETCWKKDGNIFSVIPPESFIEVKWADLLRRDVVSMAIKVGLHRRFHTPQRQTSESRLHVD